jgi:hypothetical protein
MKNKELSLNEKVLRQEILNLLEKPRATSVIADVVKEGYWKVVVLLQQMEEEGLICKVQKSKHRSEWCFGDSK